MDLTLGFLITFTLLSATQAQQEPQIAPQSPEQAPQGRSSPLGVRYSASTDVSHVSFNSPSLTYGNSLNEIQLPAAPIKPANLRQAAQEDSSENDTEGTEVQNEAQSQQIVSQNQITQAIQSEPAQNQQQFISVQQYPARPQLKSAPQSFSLSQTLPGPQPQTAVRYVPQYPSVQSQPQYTAAQPPQYTAAQPQQYPAPQPQQYPTPQPQQYTAPQPQAVQYSNPVAYSSPSSNTYFATGPFAAQQPAGNLIARQYAPAQIQPAAPQYAQTLAQPAPQQYIQQAPASYAQQVASQYEPPVASQAPQQVAQNAVAYSGTPAQLVSRVSFSGPVASFSYGF